MAEWHRLMDRFCSKWLPMALALLGLILTVPPDCAHADESMPAESATTITAVDIQVVQGQNDGFDWEGFARVLIEMVPGDRFSSGAMDRAVKALADFSEVKSYVETEPVGVRPIFVIKPFKRIKSIDFSGLFPLFERDVQSVMTISVGDLFKTQNVQDQSGLIAKRYMAEGYIKPEVRITWAQDPHDGHYHIDVAVDKGACYTLKEVNIKGAGAISEALLKSMMASWRRATAFLGTGRFLLSELKEDIAHLTAYYRSQGYVDVKIDYAIRPESNQRDVKVKAIVNEGPHYTILYSGNHFFSETVLNRDLVLFEKGNRGNTGIRRSVQNIRRRYLQAGFADVRVRRHESVPKAGPTDRRVIGIEIEEGRRHLVKKIEIRGNHAVGIDDIEGQMLTRPPKISGAVAYAGTLLQEDREAILALYRQKGFIHASVKDTVTVDAKTGGVAVVLTIEEGVRTRVGSVRLEGRLPLPERRLVKLVQYKPGEPYQPMGMQADENAVAAEIAPLGYPHVLVKGRVAISRDQKRADIVFDVDTGPFVTLGKVFVAGNFRTREAVVRRQMALEQGAPFSLVRVIKSQGLLREFDLFKSVQVRTIGLKEKSKVVHLLVTLVEKPAYFFESGGGYQTDKGVYVRMKTGDGNFLGSGDKIWTAGEVSDIGYRWDAGISDPSILGSKVRADLSLYVERRDEFNQNFGTESSGGNLTFRRPWNKQVTTVLGATYEHRRQYLRDLGDSASDSTPGDLEPRNMVVITPLVQYDSRDSFIRPRKGGLASVSADISHGLDDDLDNFVRYRSDLRFYWTPKERLTFALRGFAGAIQPYGADGQVPDDQLFFLGGTSNVRGYKENMLCFDSDMNPVGGKLALSGSVEARYDLGRNWELTVFVDAGSLGDIASKQGDTGWRWTAGMGLRYLTPIGPIGLLYGRKIDPLKEETAGEFHFSIGYTF